MNYEKSYNKYMKNIPNHTNYSQNENYTFVPNISNEISNYSNQYTNDIDINKYINDFDINKYTNDIDINKYTNDIDIHADINKIYKNEKNLPIKLPDNNGVTLIIIKNELNRENDQCRCFDYGNTPIVKKTSFTIEEAMDISRKLCIDFNKEKFNIVDFRNGLNVELEHGTRDMRTNVTNDDPILTGKIALAHLNEFPDYYVRLQKLESEASAYWKTQGFT